MSDFLHQFKIEHVEEYLKMSLGAFKENNPEFKLGIIKDE